jgi:D-sedoheptulose 7-phosphate isomerase
MADRLSQFIEAEFAKTRQNFERMAADAGLRAQILEAVAICVSALRAGNKLLFAGNGGSAADAQHWAGELVSRFYFDRPGLAAVALTTDTSALTAIGNDYGFERVFSRQVEAIGSAGDVLVAISTSGRSPNILAAIAAAHAKQMRVIGFSGETGGDMRAGCELCFCIPCADTPRIQEGHEFIGHVLCALIEQEMFGDAAG